MENENIRKRAKTAGIPLWRIAAELGVSEPTIIRRLRFSLSDERKKKIETAIKRLVDEAIERLREDGGDGKNCPYCRFNDGGGAPYVGQPSDHLRMVEDRRLSNHQDQRLLSSSRRWTAGMGEVESGGAG